MATAIRPETSAGKSDWRSLFGGLRQGQLHPEGWYAAALSSEGLVFSVPVVTLIVFVIVAIVAGMLAAIFPARRAAKLNVLEALQYE